MKIRLKRGLGKGSMKLLEEAIAARGKVLAGNVLKVDGFLNHRIDPVLMTAAGEEIARLFCADKPTLVLTAEASGIAIALAAATALGIPMLFAKKNNTSNLSSDVYGAEVYSYTHNRTYRLVVAKEYLSSCDRVVLVDDFLANGAALEGLLSLTEQAGAVCLGAAIAIEKGFQAGGAALRARGLRVESLAIIESMENGRIVFRH